MSRPAAVLASGEAMDREQAEQALAIIRQVVENTRDDLVARNWGLIWMIHAFINLAAFAWVGLVVERQRLAIYWYLPPLAPALGPNLPLFIILVNPPPPLPTHP